MLKEKLAGKYLSVFGASMCTYEGYSNDATTNSTIGNNKVYYTARQMNAEDTFWMQVVDELDMKLLVNNSWSGSAVSFVRAGAQPAYLDRCRQLHADTGANAGTNPDIIVSFMGCNDYKQPGVILGTVSPEMLAIIDQNVNNDDYRGETFAECYAMMLARVVAYYPNAEVFVFNMPYTAQYSLEDAEAYHDVISSIAEYYGCHVIDLAHSKMSGANYTPYSLDGLHPNAEGMDIWTELIIGEFIDCFLTNQSLDNHEYNRFDKQPTCVTQGFTQYTCVCGSSYIENKVSALGHSYDEGVVTAAPDCTSDGVRTFTCETCGSISTEAIPAVGHTEEATPAVAPTCTTTGLTEGSHCSVCNEVLIAQEGIDALGHSFAVVSIVPTPTAKGYSIYTCTRCSDSYRTAWLHENAYKGLRIACVGDSITAAYGVTKDKTDYVTLLARNLGMDYIRLGVSGTTLCTDGSRACNIGQLTESKLNGADVVTILMGINDFCAAGAGYYELGDINSRDTSTIYGAMRMWCERIVQLQKTDSLSNTKFYFVTPVICSWNNSVTSGRNWDQSKTNIHRYTLRDMCNAIIEVANCYGISVIDLNILSGMYYVDAANNNTAVFGGDGVHPGEKGHAMMADALANILLQSDLRDDHSHVFGSWITTTWPSCRAGEQQRVCNICFATEGRPLEPNGSHRYRTAITTSTCETAGYTTYTCSICNDSYTADETPAAGHTYDDGVETLAPTYTKEGVKTFTCTTCGDTYTEVIPSLDYSDSNPYKGKVFSIMGDSISTFAGYIPTADGFNRTHLARYPQDNLLTDVYATWWMQAIVDLDAKLGINDSWRGATVSGAHPVTSGDTGENAAMSNLVRIQNLGSNGTPDVILFYGGTNDIAHVSKIGSFDLESAPSTVDLTTMKWDNLADAYSHTLLRMKHYYPDAIILALLPTYTASYYSDARLAQANETLVDICEYYGVPYIDLRDCGITADDLPDGIHPGEHGMDLITAAVIDALLTIDVPEGENVVYSVTHNLSNATASRGYYKGISAGTSFEETLTGDNLSVTVTMGGKDITAACYSDGQVFIEKVTGALEITAKSPFSLGNHLQKIPSEAYNNTNLWQVLKPEKGYFKGAEWVSNYSSVTIPVTAGDQLWATSFGASGENGGSMNGIRVTYFDAYGMLATIEPDAVYDEFQQNGYLTVPEGATAVCITMWTNTNAELYLLTLPDGPVLPGSHLQSIPTPVCSGVNLWQVLKPEKGYFKGATWVDYYSSVTFPVVAGDQLWATSFGASGDNGGTINGIRVTYFDAHGMLATLEATTVYEEFLKNGCVTVPEQAIAVNVVMWAGDASDELYILNLEHNYDDGVETLAPSCTVDGVKTFTCEICGSIRTEAIPAVGHTEEAIPAVAPSCTDTGLTEGVQCAICGEILTKPQEVAALGHSFGEGKVTVAPTCTGEGVSIHICAVCGVSYTEVLPSKGHTAVSVPAAAPTCTSSGWSEGKKCSVCGDILSVQTEIPAVGHISEVLPAVAPRCTFTGLTEGEHCAVCGEILIPQVEIPARGHTEGNTIVIQRPTLTQPGTAIIICSVCGETLRTENVPACLPGDANMDGKVNLSDAVCILRDRSGQTAAINFHNADVTGDGLVTIQDALRLMQYEAGWDVTLEHLCSDEATGGLDAVDKFEVPMTGDTSTPMLWLGFCVFSALALANLSRKQKEIR